MSEHYPWHDSIMQKVAEQLREERLPHALLLAGAAGLGKQQFAERVAELVLCEQNVADVPCGACKSCSLLAAATHPDLQLVTLEDSRQLRIEQIRRLIGWAMQTSARGGNRIAIIYPADTMNLASANALLKLLEEPPANTYLLLVTDQLAKLLPTIRSRCQVVNFKIPDTSVAMAWLGQEGLSPEEARLRIHLSSGAPLVARDDYDEHWRERRIKLLKTLGDLVDGKVQALPAASALVSKEHPSEVYLTLYSLLADAVKLPFGQQIRNTDAESLVASIAKRYDRATLIRLSDTVVEAERLTKSVNNPNQQLLLESVMVGISA